MATQVYYLGPPYTFGEQAALRFAETLRNAPERAVAPELIPQLAAISLQQLSSHENVVKAVDRSNQDFGVVAVENSLFGAVNESIDTILHYKQVSVCAEIVIPIEHHLIAAPGTKLEQVSTVMSHPAALAQCHDFLVANLPAARLDASLSTAAAVEEAMRTPGAAALASKRAAEAYGGEILAASVQDEDSNKTRFFVLAHHDAPPTGDDKTSIAFNVADRPGSLVSVMRHLADRGLNLTRIESRPSREELGKYIFLIDFQGHRSDPAAREAIEAIKADGAVLLPAGEPLGSYPRFHD